MVSLKKLMTAALFLIKQYDLTEKSQKDSTNNKKIRYKGDVHLDLIHDDEKDKGVYFDASKKDEKGKEPVFLVNENEDILILTERKINDSIKKYFPITKHAYDKLNPEVQAKLCLMEIVNSSLRNRILYNPADRVGTNFMNNQPVYRIRIPYEISKLFDKIDSKISNLKCKYESNYFFGKKGEQ